MQFFKVHIISKTDSVDNVALKRHKTWTKRGKTGNISFEWYQQSLYSKTVWKCYSFVLSDCVVVKIYFACGV